MRGFEGMRAIACLMVIYHHLCQRVDLKAAVPPFLHPLVLLGYRFEMGVSVFFVLSGALLSMPFWKRYFDHAPAPPLGAYAFRRAARILPAYWLALGVCVLVGLRALPSARYVLARFVAGACFVSSLHYVSFFPAELDPTLWSISLEVICYVLLPVLILPVWQLGTNRQPARVACYLIAVLVGLQLAHFLILDVFMTDPFEKGWQYGLIGGAKQWLPYWNPASFMTQFMLGSCAAFAIVWRRRQARPIAAAAFDIRAIGSLAAAFLVCAGLGQMGRPNLLTRQPYVTPVFPALCAAALYAMHFGKLVPTLLDNRLLRFVSTISFGIYLWHWPVLEIIRIYWVPDFKVFALRSGSTWLLLCAVTVAVSVLLASLSFYALEQPVLRLAQRLSPRTGR